MSTQAIDIASNAKHVRFVQLYTSKTYDDKRNKLVAPSKRMTDRLFRKRSGWEADDEDDNDPSVIDEEAQDVKRHVLSPRLVDAIASTSQVVWANCQKQEGLLGRSDMLLQTAVGLPVATNNRGQMCVVVMFSPSNLQSNDDAVDYLQFITKCAMSTSIPCLHPVLQFNESSSVGQLWPVNVSSTLNAPPRDLGDGVVARYVSFRDNVDDEQSDSHANAVSCSVGTQLCSCTVRLCEELIKAMIYDIFCFATGERRDASA